MQYAVQCWIEDIHTVEVFYCVMFCQACRWSVLWPCGSSRLCQVNPSNTDATSVASLANCFFMHVSEAGDQIYHTLHCFHQVNTDHLPISRCWQHQTRYMLHNHQRHNKVRLTNWILNLPVSLLRLCSGGGRGGRREWHVQHCRGRRYQLIQYDRRQAQLGTVRHRDLALFWAAQPVSEQFHYR